MGRVRVNNYVRDCRRCDERFRTIYKEGRICSDCKIPAGNNKMVKGNNLTVAKALLNAELNQLLGEVYIPCKDSMSYRTFIRLVLRFQQEEIILTEKKFSGNKGNYRILLKIERLKLTEWINTHGI